MRMYKCSLLKHCLFVMMLLPAILITSNVYGQFSITDKSPSPQSTQVLSSEAVEIEFNQNVNFSTVENGIFLHSSLTGSIPGSFEQLGGNRIAFRATSGFTGGEKIFVTVTDNLLSENGNSLSATQQWTFTVMPEVGLDQFTRLEYDLSEGSEPSAIASVDINNNLLPDLVVVNSNNSKVTILENQFHIIGDFFVREPIDTGVDQNAAEKLSEEESALLASTLPVNSGITSADFNRNGYPDVVIAATLNNQLILLRNSADGQVNFDVELIDTGERPVEVIAADINNNGYSDLVVAAAGSDQILIHYNNGDGTFGSPVSIDVGSVPLSFVTEDINNSGFLDIVIALAGENRVVGLMNLDGDSFSTETLIDDLSFTPSFIMTDNFIFSENDEEFADIALGSSDEPEIYLYRNESGVFSFFNTLSSAQLSRPIFGISSDVDASGSLDIVSSRFSSNSILINRNSLDGFLDHAIVDQLDSPTGITTTDFSFSGSMDFAIANSNSGTVTVLINNDDRGVCLIGDDLAFGDVCVGESAVEIIEIVNICPYTLDVSISISNSAFSTDITGFKIEPFETISLPVTFTPNQRGTFSGELILTYVRERGVIEDEVRFGLFGNGVESELQIVEELDFGTLQVGASDSRTIDILNTGNIDVEIDLSIEGGDGVFSIEEPANFTLGPNQQSNAIVTFTPEEFEDYEGELVVTVTSDCGETVYRVQLTGSGVDPITELEVPELIDFGEVETGLSETINFSVANTGNVETTVDLLLQGDDVFSISGPQSFTIAPNTQQNVPLIFSPTETVEYNTDIVVNGSSDFDDVQYTIVATGVGINPLPDLVAVQIVPESISGDYMLGESYRFDATFRLERNADVTDPFDLQFLVNNQEQERIRFTEQLSPGDSRTVQFFHTFSTEGQNNVQFVVDPDDEIEEFTTDNNMASVSINVRQGRVSVAPNPFTPNNDGYNDIVDFDLSRLANISSPVVRIFSFNGRLVQTLRDFNGQSIQWNGTDNSGNQLRPGVYLYVIEENNRLLARGSITLAL